MAHANRTHVGDIQGIPIYQNSTYFYIDPTSNITTTHGLYILPYTFEDIARDLWICLEITALALTLISTVLAVSAVLSVLRSDASSPQTGSRTRGLARLLGALTLTSITIPIHFLLGRSDWGLMAERFGVPWWLLMDPWSICAWDVFTAFICAITLLVVLAGMVCPRKPVARDIELVAGGGDKEDGASAI